MIPDVSKVGPSLIHKGSNNEPIRCSFGSKFDPPRIPGGSTVEPIGFQYGSKCRLIAALKIRTNDFKMKGSGRQTNFGKTVCLPKLGFELLPAKAGLLFR